MQTPALTLPFSLRCPDSHGSAVEEGRVPLGQPMLSELTCVDDDVLRQVTHVDEGFVADAALVGPNVVVVPNVVGQLAGLNKPSPEEGKDHVRYRE